MRKIGYVAILAAMTFCQAGLAQMGKTTEKNKLGYKTVQIGDEEIVKLMIGRIITGLHQDDPYLYLSLLADEYQEVPVTTEGPTGFVLAKNGQKLRLRSVFQGRDVFLKNVAETKSTLYESIDIKVRDILLQGDSFDCTLEAVAAARNSLGCIRLFFSKTEYGWRLSMSDGLSLFAKFKPQNALLKGKDQENFAEEYLISNQIATSNRDERTFRETEISSEYNITSLNKKVTLDRLNRKLFRQPSGSALFAHVRQFATAPYFDASYVQMVTDPAWNRIVYGDYQKWLKAYDAAETGKPFNRPYGIAVDARGVVYVADAGNSRIVVLKLSGPPEDLSLLYLGTLGESVLSQPTELAWDDRGTIEDATDDLLWIVDSGKNTIYASKTNLASKTMLVEYKNEHLRNPAAIAIGRFNGRCDHNIFVVDNGSRTVYRLYFDGANLHEVGTWQGQAEIFATALSTDHWGNLYLTDQSSKEVLKLSPGLEPLARFRVESDDFKPLRFQTLFGSLQRLDEPALLWSGYDQALLLEEWTQKTGARRIELGVDLQINTVKLSPELDQVVFSGKLTDPGQVKLYLESKEVGDIYEATFDSWQQAGSFTQRWDRRLADGKMIAPGYYSLHAVVNSTYNKQEKFENDDKFYIPLYYYEDCGKSGVASEHLIRGAQDISAGVMAEKSVVTDANEVVYRFKNFSPALAYEVRATYFTTAEPVKQVLYANDLSLHAPMLIGQSALRTAWLSVPSAAIQNGELKLHIQKTAGHGPVSVAEIWVRESEFDPNNPPAIEVSEAAIPSDYALQQNYPNPFNPTTTIEFSIPQSHRGVVTLRIYNMLGQLVRELENAEIAPGVYRKTWNGLDEQGRRVASGVFIYQMRAGQFTASRKLVMMK